MPDGAGSLKTRDGRLSVARRDNTIAVRLLDRLIVDEQAVAEITRDIIKCIGNISEPTVLVDLCKVQHMSSRLVAQLILIQNRATRAGGRFALVGVGPAIADVFLVTRLNKRIPIFDTIQDALSYRIGHE